MAASVLARMRRGGAGDAATLAGMMDLHRRRGDDDIAAEIARDVLARFGPQSGGARGGNRAAADAPRPRGADAPQPRPARTGVGRPAGETGAEPRQRGTSAAG